jgi:segregation and condensation protein B
VQRPATTRPERDSRNGPDAAIEAALFCADEPLSPRRLAILIQSQRGTNLTECIRRLQKMLDEEGSALEIVELAGGFQLVTRVEYFPWLVRLRRSGGEPKLTPALLETLAIIAYRQPIMRADLEAIRGVHCGDALRDLMERGLVRIAGRHDSLGRPIIYGTTKRFLQLFGLRDLGELPPLDGESKNAGVH